MTRITIVGAIGTGATVARNPMVAVSSQNIASNVNVWTPTIKVTLAVKEVASLRNTKEMATVMTRTTIAAASMMAVIAVLKPSRGEQ